MRMRSILPILALVVTGILLVYPIFKDGYLIAQDNPPHLAEAYFLIEELIPQGKLYGWSNIESAGFPIFIFNYPVGVWIVAIIHFLSNISVINAYKLMVLISYIVPAILVYFLLKRFVDSKIALVVAILLLFQFDFISFTFSGLWGQYIGLIFGLGYIYILTKSELKIRDSIPLGILISLSFLSHPFTVVFLLYFTIVFAVMGVLKSNTNKMLAILLVGWIIGFSLLPWKSYLDSSALLGSQGEFTSDNLSTLVFKSLGYLFLPHMRAEEIKTQVGWISGEINVGNVVNNLANLLLFSVLNIAESIFGLLSLIGLVYFFRQRTTESSLFFVTLVISVAIASGILNFFGLNQFPIIGSLFQFPRYFVYARIAMSIFAAYGIVEIARSQIARKINTKLFHGNILIVGLIGYIVLLLSFSQINGFLNLKTSDEVKEMVDINNVWTWIKENAGSKETRVLYQNTFGNFGVNDLRNSHIFALSTKNTGVESLGTWQGGFPLISSKFYTGGGQIFGSDIETIEVSKLADSMKAYNAMYVVVSESKLKDKIENSGLFKFETNYGNFSIYSVVGYSPTLIRINNVDMSVEIMVNKMETKTFRFVSDKPSKITVKISYHPYWKVYVNKKEVETERNSLGLIEIDTIETGEIFLELLYKDR